MTDTAIEQLQLDLGFNALEDVHSTYRLGGALSVTYDSDGLGGGQLVRVSLVNPVTGEMVAEGDAIVTAITVRHHKATDADAAWIERGHALKLQ